MATATTTEEIALMAGQYWRHRNGIRYEVLALANEQAATENRERYPVTVVYRNPSNNTIWTRPLSDWHRSMTLEA